MGIPAPGTRGHDPPRRSGHGTLQGQRSGELFDRRGPRCRRAGRESADRQRRVEGALAADAAPASYTPPLRGRSPASRRGDARASEYLPRRRRQPAASLCPPRSVSRDFAVSFSAVRPSLALFSVIPSVATCPPKRAVAIAALRLRWSAVAARRRHSGFGASATSAEALARRRLQRRRRDLPSSLRVAASAPRTRADSSLRSE